MIEAVAWVGSRDEAVSREAHRRVEADIALGSAGACGIEGWFWLDGVLSSSFETDFDAAALQLFTCCVAGRIVAIGRRSASGGYETVESLEWVAAKLSHRIGGFEPIGSEGGLIRDCWRDVLFPSSGLLEAFPERPTAPETPATSVPVATIEKAAGSLKSWVAAEAEHNPSWTIAWKRMQVQMKAGQFQKVSRANFKREYEKHHPDPVPGPKGGTSRKNSP